MPIFKLMNYMDFYVFVNAEIPTFGINKSKVGQRIKTAFIDLILQA